MSVRVLLIVSLAIWLASVSLIGCGQVQPGGVIPGLPGVGQAGFVGLEVCKSCHSASVAEHANTKHARALSVLQSAGQDTNSACLPCHTVGRGTQDQSAYVDANSTPYLANVQCENCHGPGGLHAGNPDANLMTVSMSADICGTCHTGFHHPTYDQWKETGHGSALQTIATNSHASASCLACHSAEYILAQPLPTIPTPSAGAAELGPVAQPAQNSITCVVCHDPHSAGHESQLRTDVNDLCIQCHTAGDALPGGTPHHAQRELVLGLPMGVDGAGNLLDPDNSAHTLTTATGRCVVCHVYRETREDPTIENPNNTGHTFLATNMAACALQNCHPSATQAETTKNQVQQEVQTLLDSTGARIAAINRSSLSADDQKLYDRAKFDYALVEADGSRGVHNTDYVRQLLSTANSILDQIAGSS